MSSFYFAKNDLLALQKSLREFVALMPTFGSSLLSELFLI